MYRTELYADTPIDFGKFGAESGYGQLKARDLTKSLDDIEYLYYLQSKGILLHDDLKICILSYHIRAYYDAKHDLSDLITELENLTNNKN